MLDRLAGPNPPTIVCVDPRPTPVAEHATNLAPLPGTNVALMNGLLQQIVEHDWIDQDWIDCHTVGFEELRTQLAPYTPEKVAAICDVPADDLREAARLLATTDRRWANAMLKVLAPQVLAS